MLEVRSVLPTEEWLATLSDDPGKFLKLRILAEQAPGPIELAKQILSEGLERALEQERHFQATLFLTKDFEEGRAAFLAKRNPVFRGD